MSYYILRQAARVKRYHTVPTIRTQTTGEHSYGVLMILMHVFDYEVPRELMRAALFHDLAEISTGDTPATAKWKSPELKRQLEMMEASFEKSNRIEYNLTEQEQIVFKFADMMELCMFCKEEIKMGNTEALEPLANGLSLLNTLNFSELPLKAVRMIDDVATFVRKYAK